MKYLKFIKRWHCECEFVRKFRAFIDANLNIVRDAKSITCTSTETNLVDVGCSDLVHSGNEQTFFFRGKILLQNHLVSIVAGVVTFLCVMLVISCVTVRRLKEPILIWLHDKHGVRICKSENRSKKLERSDAILFEALVIHSLKDESEVMTMVKQLEPIYRVCLNHRDLSGIYTSEAFKSAVSASVCHMVNSFCWYFDLP